MESRFSSFVGLHPLPARHGMTMGEIANYLRSCFHPGLSLHVRRAPGWHRPHYLDETGLKWAMPSPNMPTLDTAVVYPGGVLFEGTIIAIRRSGR